MYCTVRVQISVEYSIDQVVKYFRTFVLSYFRTCTRTRTRVHVRVLSKYLYFQSIFVLSYESTFVLSYEIKYESTVRVHVYCTVSYFRTFIQRGTFNTVRKREIEARANDFRAPDGLLASLNKYFIRPSYISGVVLLFLGEFEKSSPPNCIEVLSTRKCLKRTTSTYHFAQNPSTDKRTN